MSRNPELSPLKRLGLDIKRLFGRNKSKEAVDLGPAIPALREAFRASAEARIFDPRREAQYRFKMTIEVELSKRFGLDRDDPFIKELAEEAIQSPSVKAADPYASQSGDQLSSQNATRLERLDGKLGR